MNGVDEEGKKNGMRRKFAVREVNEREKKVINRSAWGDEEINFLSFLPSLVFFLPYNYFLKKELHAWGVN